MMHVGGRSNLGGAHPIPLSQTLAHVLVVVPTLNEEGHIIECLRSLMPAKGARIVVVDGGSTDETVELVSWFAAENPEVTLIHNPDRVQSAGINAAVSDMAGPGQTMMVRCDAHSTYPPDYVTRLAEALEETGAASVVVPMDATGRTPFARAAAWIVDTPLGSGGAAHRGGQRSGFTDHGHHAAMDLAWFNRIDGYDPTFDVNEDAELDQRLSEAGGGIWLDASIRLSYVMRPTPLALAQQYYRYGRGRAATVLKHRMRPRLRQIIPVLHVLALLGSVALWPVTPLWSAYPLFYAALLAAVSLLGAQMIGRDGWWAGFALGTMHTCWGLGFLSRLLVRS